LAGYFAYKDTRKQAQKEIQIMRDESKRCIVANHQSGALCLSCDFFKGVEMEDTDSSNQVVSEEMKSKIQYYGVVTVVDRAKECGGRRMSATVVNMGNLEV
jgi:predicted lactoylglutathione lyase